ncbi:MAG: hypothetical protein ICV68_15845 [Pyrinomonadaceae bacterium]|nr:hypothetical protein [Pyrinomonadaceae bacterium]
MRGVLLAILSREEYSERIANFGRDSDLLEGVEVPLRSAVRITDLRLAMVLELEESKRFLLPALRSLESPITAERVIEWKHQIIGNKAEDEPDPFWEEFGDQINKIANKAASGHPDQEAWDALMEEMQEYKGAHAPKPATAELTEEELVSRRIEIATASFAVAALFLFMDVDMPSVRDEKPYRLDEQIRELAAIVKRLMSDLEDGSQELFQLLANRPAGRQPRLESHFYHALCYWRYGYSPEDIGRWLGITPYSSKTGKGTRDWKTKLNRMLARGKEIENKRYPRAAAIFANYRDSPHIRRKAHRAYRAYLVQTARLPGYPPLNEVGRKIRVNHQKQRGLEIIQAYIQLGSCLVRGKPTSP